MNDKQQQRSVAWLDLGRYEYAEALHLQETLRDRRQRGEIPDVVILLEHFPCITIGNGGGHHNLLVDPPFLEQQGIAVHEASRGGNITYHGPGQLVCYPILKLTDEQHDLHAYARKMEEVMIRTLQAFGITAGRKSKFPGAWVNEAKIGAMGIAVRKWTTMHGIALNVCPDLRHFSLIIPCGIASHRVTSMAQILGHPIDISAVRREMRQQFSQIFKLPLHSGHLQELIEEDACETA